MPRIPLRGFTDNGTAGHPWAGVVKHCNRRYRMAINPLGKKSDVPCLPPCFPECDGGAKPSDICVSIGKKTFVFSLFSFSTLGKKSDVPC